MAEVVTTWTDLFAVYDTLRVFVVWMAGETPFKVFSLTSGSKLLEIFSIPYVLLQKL